jgi:hypothetical protein
MITVDDSVANAIERFDDGVDDTGVNVIDAGEDVDDIGVDVHFNDEVDTQAYNATTGVTTGGTSRDFANFARHAKQTSQESTSSIDLPV